VPSDFPAAAIRIVNLKRIATDVGFDVEDVSRPPCDGPGSGIAAANRFQFAARFKSGMVRPKTFSDTPQPRYRQGQPAGRPPRISAARRNDRAVPGGYIGSLVPDFL